MDTDQKYENWEQSGFLERGIMTGYAGRKSFEWIKKAAEKLGMVETLHKETKRGLIHFTFRGPKPKPTPVGGP
jgi:hypothetical protein